MATLRKIVASLVAVTFWLAGPAAAAYAVSAPLTTSSTAPSSAPLSTPSSSPLSAPSNAPLRAPSSAPFSPPSNAPSAQKGMSGRAALADGYTYWGFYAWDDKNSSWPYSRVGANDPKQLPEDGDVYGFRWALNVGSDTRAPRADGDFDAICGGEQTGDGEKRIAFVIDFGTEADAEEGDEAPQPRGACAVAEDSFTVQQALQTVAPIRTGDGGLICAIDDYPSQGCGDQVTDVQEPPADDPVTLALPGEGTPAGDGTSKPTDGGNLSGSDGSTASDDSSATDASSDEGSGNATTLIVALIVVVALAVGALVLRQRKS